MININKRSILALVVIVFIVTVLFSNLFEGKLLVKSISPDNNNIISVKAKSAFSFGPNKVIIKVKKSGLIGCFTAKKYDTYIFNDGGALFEDNIGITWIDNDCAMITLLGEEQLPEEIEVTFDKKIKINNKSEKEVSFQLTSFSDFFYFRVKVLYDK